MFHSSEHKLKMSRLLRSSIIDAKPLSVNLFVFFPKASDFEYFLFSVLISSFFETHLKIKTSEKILRRFDLSEIIFKLKKN